MKTIAILAGMVLFSLNGTSCIQQSKNEHNNTIMEATNHTNQNSNNELDTATFGSGCFWCADAIFKEVKGVKKVESGFSGGDIKNPSYREVCTGRTGHAEVVQVYYDPKVVSYDELLEIFWKTHDPTTLNRQGNDVGTQYRSGIYTFDEDQQAEALASRQAYDLVLRKAGYSPVTTEVLSAPVMYYAEDYHQQYLAKNPAGYCGLGGTGVSCPVGLPVS